MEVVEPVIWSETIRGRGTFAEWLAEFRAIDHLMRQRGRARLAPHSSS
jgi:hypothetical protein